MGPKVGKEHKEADGEKSQFERTPDSGDGLLAKPHPDAPVLVVLDPLVDHQEDMEDRGDKADGHYGVVLAARGRSRRKGVQQGRATKEV